MIELRKLRPELGEHGGDLAQALNAELLRIGSTLCATAVELFSDHIVHARVEHGVRFSQIYLAAEERLFLFDAWHAGVCLGTGSAPDIALIARVIDTWVSGADSIFALVDRFPSFVEADAHPHSFERGTEVEDRWRDYMGDDCEPRLVAAAYKRPRLRQLFPIFSLYSLCFSRYTGYPYSRDLPSIRRANGETYIVTHPARGESEPLDLERALDLLLAQVPDDCGPAMAGTCPD